MQKTYSLALLCLLLSMLQIQAQSVWIYGEITPPSAQDVLTISLNTGQKTELFKQELKPGNLFIAGFGKAYFSFQTPTIDKPTQLSVHLNQRAIINHYWVFPGDSIQFMADRNKGRIVFGGPAANQFKTQFEIDYLIDENTFSKSSFFGVEDKEKFLNDSSNYAQYSSANAIYGRQTEIANNDINVYIKRMLNAYHHDYNPTLNSLYYQFNKGELYKLMFLSHLGRAMFFVSQSSRLKYNELNRTEQFSDAASLKEAYNDFVDYTESLFEDQDWTRYKVLSSQYLDGKTEQIITTNHFGNQDPNTYLKSLPRGAERDNLINNYLNKVSKKISDIPEANEFFLPLIEDEAISKNINTLLNALQNGGQVDLSPFTTLDQQSSDLSANSGKIQLLDLWFTGCGACLVFYKNILLPLHEEFGHRDDFQIVSISVDRSYDLWVKSVKANKYTNADFVNFATLDQKHPFLLNYNIRSFPHHMLIGKDLSILKGTDFPTELEEWKKLIETHLKQ
jgi:hypothetical protein